VLANIYLHYVLDLWFEKKFKAWCQGEAYLVRFADDCAPRRRGKEACVPFRVERGQLRADVPV
jgi:hypothetical protein